MGECACRRSGVQAKLQELPCGEHMIVVRDESGGWRAVNAQGAPDSRFTLWPDADGVTLSDGETGDQRRYVALLPALMAVCDLCDGPAAPCKQHDPGAPIDDLPAS